MSTEKNRAYIKTIIWMMKSGGWLNHLMMLVMAWTI